MDDIALRLDIGDLCAAYADCIDDDRLEEWPDFFVEDCRYLVTDRVSHQAGLRPGIIYCGSPRHGVRHQAGLPHGIIYCASRGMVLDGVMAMRRANIFEPHRYRHIVGPARLG